MGLVTEAIVERIDAIADWRRERGQQDMLGLGPEAAMRSKRSEAGLRELSAFFSSLPDDDPRVKRLHSLAFSGSYFDPGASLLEELGRFRFHEGDTPIETFVDQMVTWAERDRDEMGQWGGPQLPGDNPWRATTTIRVIDPDEIEADW